MHRIERWADSEHAGAPRSSLIMLDIIIVNWNVCGMLRACLRSVQRHPASRHTQRIIVVDNGSTDGSLAMLRDEFPSVHVIANERNAGYGGGNNVGLAYAKDLPAAGRTRYALILNPDTEVTAGALDALLDFAEDNPDVGIVGPQLRYADGSV
ncbi:MAG: glycosyltransferase family 2 protein, partial [Anaerolineae bacterium]|nr:glycosyltransferase family 2 protein [Thermoflexales bacterium]MDW8408791.1 glycosyltransferase family 2 protein [Anaerolineae bacterium]